MSNAENLSWRCVRLRLAACSSDIILTSGICAKAVGFATELDRGYNDAKMAILGRDMNPKLTISKTTARRFVLGRQGLWPGRRWQGVDGVTEALHTCEALQLDPLNVIARSHDIALWGRVLDYRPEHLHEVAYNRRGFFDYGGLLSLYPMSELPYWWRHMAAFGEYPRWRTFAAEHGNVISQVLDELRARGPLGNRDFAGNARVNSYRGRKDTALALYQLWATGRVMIHHREGFERVYDLRERVAPAEHDTRASEAELEAYFAAKTLAFLGIARLQSWRVSTADYIARRIEKGEAEAWMARLTDEGTTVPIRLEGAKEIHYALASDLPLLETVAAGGVPVSWTPLDVTTEDEVVFLAPLDIVSARGRAAVLFDFDYVWEVYKPAHQRRWGYYTVPILWGDRLVARVDAKLNRKAKTLELLGFWPEERQRLGLSHDLTADEAFVAAFQRGLARFAAFTGAEQISATVLEWLSFKVGNCATVANLPVSEVQT